MASQNDVAEFEALGKRQIEILKKIDALQSRVDFLQQQQETTPTQFEELQSRQSQIFERLLKVSQNIKRVAKDKNVALPEQEAVDNIVVAIAKDLQKRQEAVINKLTMYKNMANSISAFQSSEEDEQKRDDAVQEAGGSDHRARRHELKCVADCLRHLCLKLDDDPPVGKITTDQMLSILKKVSMIEHDIFRTKIILAASSDSDGIMEYEKFLDLFADIDSTSKQSDSSGWDTFRSNLIGKGRNDGSLRILYRYDGWPTPLAITISNVETSDKKDIQVNAVVNHIRMKVEDQVEFAQLRYATYPSFIEGKRGWKGINSDSESVPFLVHNDGTLEVDIWLRTQNFIDSKGGRPMPSA